LCNNRDNKHWFLPGSKLASLKLASLEPESLELVSMEGPTLLRALGALFIVIAMLGGFAWLLKRYGHKFNLVGPMIQTKNKRLAVVESLTLDPRRRLLLIRRDQVEHLVLIAHDGQLVVEHGISAPKEVPQGHALQVGMEGVS
jgi:flagellar protein FliO/FliZ